MLRALFARLTDRQRRGHETFSALVAEARQPGWFVEGEVPDTIDGRFAVLASVIALATVRLEAGGEVGRASSVALTERFIEAMDAEHRQLGLGDPSVGKKVRKLVGALAERVELWRDAVASPDWSAAVAASLYRDSPGSDDARCWSEARLKQLWARLGTASDAAIAQGSIG